MRTTAADIRIQAQNSDQACRAHAEEFAVLHHVHGLRAVDILAFQLHPLRDVASGHLRVNDSVPLDVSRFFIFLSRRGRADDETHAGDPDKRPPNKRCEFHIAQILLSPIVEVNGH